MTRQMMLLSGVVALIVTPALGAPNVGDKAPKISADEWYNLPRGVKSIKQSHLDGQIVMLEFWATWCGPCRASVPHLVEMQKKYKSKGVVLVALSDEPESKVKPFIKNNKATYIIGSGAESAKKEYGVQGIPHVFLIDPHGKIAWKGHPAVVEPELKKLLKDKPPKKRSFLSASSAKSAYRKASKLYDAGNYSSAKREFESLAKDFKSSKYAKKAKSKLKKMKANSRIMEIIEREKADRLSKGWLEAARILAQYGDKKDAIKYYKRIIKKFPDTEYAKLARTEKKLLED